MFGMLLIVVFIVIVLFAIGAYNRLVSLRNQVQNAWKQIDVQLKRRHDLIPNLVRVVSGYATHERSTLDEVSQARNQAVAAKSPADQAQAENVLTGALSKLFANVERYPELKAEGDFQRLETELEQIEGVIAMSRQSYNLTIQAYNNGVDTFPTNLAAWFAGFGDRTYLTAEESDRPVPQVDMGVPPAPTVVH